MAMPTLPRFLLPRAPLYMRSPRLASLIALPSRSTQQQQQQQQRLASSSQRSSSNSSKNKQAKKPLVLEKPSRFNPPSHPARLPPRRQRPSYPGPALSEKEKEAQKTKQYPHMMPPEGSFLHWFLTNRTIHVWITMSILCSLAFFTWLTNFLNSTPYKDQLPPNNMFFAHPFAFLGRYIEVYRLHTEYVSAQTAERRKHKVEDVRKRAEYRKAHGLDQEGVFGGWDVRKDEEVMGPGKRERDDVLPVGLGAAEVVEREVQQGVEEGDEGVEVEKRRPVRKWLGIW